MQYSGFKEHADTFILVYPQGAYYDDKETTGWNTEDGGVNDVAFQTLWDLLEQFDMNGAKRK